MAADRDHLGETQAFFAPRAAGWDDRFPDDGPKYAAAVSALHLPVGGVVVDIGCGTGRGFRHLRAAVGRSGTVVGLDATAEMCAVAKPRGPVVVGDAAHLPIPDGRCDGVFAAGLLPHLDDKPRALRELARVTRPNGHLAVFHAISRAALAERHGHGLSEADPLAADNLDGLLAMTGWRLADIDDGPDRYLAIADRAPG